MPGNHSKECEVESNVAQGECCHVSSVMRRGVPSKKLESEWLESREGVLRVGSGQA